jgi:hypothetical protein
MIDEGIIDFARVRLGSNAIRTQSRNLKRFVLESLLVTTAYTCNI